MRSTNRLFLYLRLSLFALYFIHGVFIITQNSLTGDEMNHWSYGKRMLMLRPERIYTSDDASTMPISGFNAVPRAIEQLIQPDLEKDDGGYSDIINGRFVTLIICFLIGVFIYKWSRENFGEQAGLFSLFLFVFCPNLNANTSLLTTDAYAALFTLTTFYYFHRFYKYSGWNNFLLFCIHLGIAQIAKPSLILLPFFYGIISIFILIHRKTVLSRWRIHLMRIFVLGLIVLFIINVAFFFKGSGNSLSEYTFHSSYFRKLSTSSIRNIPIPLPSAFLHGYDLVKHMVSLGSGNEGVSTRSYLLGNYFTGNLWYYYVVVLLFKTPLLTLFLLVSILFLVLKKRLKKHFDTLLPLSIAFAFLIMFSLFNSSQHSIRHLIMIYPLIYIAIAQSINSRIFQKRGILIAALLYSVATFYYYFPNLISYTNEFIIPKRNTYKWIASSNIDYGQCNNSYMQYQLNNPDVRVPGEIPAAGNYIISINYYLGLEGKGKYEWLKNFKPYAHVNHCFLLVKITEADLLKIKHQ